MSDLCSKCRKPIPASAYVFVGPGDEPLCQPCFGAGLAPERNGGTMETKLKIDGGAPRVRVTAPDGKYVGLFDAADAAHFPATYRRDPEPASTFLRRADGASVALVTDPTYVATFAAAPMLREVVRRLCVMLASAGEEANADSNNPLEALHADALAAYHAATGDANPFATATAEVCAGNRAALAAADERVTP